MTGYRKLGAYRRVAIMLAGAALLAGVLPGAASARNYTPATPSRLCSGVGSAGGQCGELTGIAVDQSTGMVYAADKTNLRVEQFEPNGTFVRAFGADVVSSGQHNTGTGAEVCEPANSSPQDVCKAGIGTATVPGAFGEKPFGVAVDPITHVVYVVTATTRIAFFNGQTGAFIGQTEGNTTTSGAVNAGSPEKLSGTTGVAVDTSTPSQHYLYVALEPTVPPLSNTKAFIDKFAIPNSGTAGLLAGSFVCQITGTATDTTFNGVSYTNGGHECGTPGPSHKDGAFEGLLTGTSTAGTKQEGGDLAVDSAGNVFIAEQLNSTTSAGREVVSEFSGAGAFVSQFEPSGTDHRSPRPEGLAALSGGKLVVLDDGAPTGALEPLGALRVQVYKPSDTPAAVPVPKGSSRSSFRLPAVVEGSGFVAPSSTTITGASGAFLKQQAISGAGIQPGTRITGVSGTTLTISPATEATAGGTVPLQSFSGSMGVAVDAAGDLFVTDRLNEGRIWVFAPTGGEEEAPKIEEEKSEQVSGFSAKLVAKINPHNVTVNAAVSSQPTGYKDCEFEYTTDPNLHKNVTSLPCTTPSNLGSGETGVLTSLTVGSQANPLLPNKTYYWRAYAANLEGSTEGEAEVKSFTTGPAPAGATTDPAGSLGETTAVLNGHVNNNGDASGSVCSFQVALAGDGSFSSPVQTISCGTVTGSSNQAVTATATGLNPNTSYIYRLSAVNAGNKDEGGNLVAASFGAAQPFTTTAGPLVSGGFSYATTETESTVVATVNPAGLATTYHVEYVGDAAYQADQPNGFEHARQSPESASVGADHTAHEVTTVLEGLMPGTVYHYRLVAQNLNGAVAGPERLLYTPSLHGCPNETLREEDSSQALADCRAYEMVSPPGKNLAGTTSGDTRRTGVARDGQAVGFTTSGQFGEPAPQVGTATADYVSRRTSAGWTTIPVSPNYCAEDPGAPAGTSANSGLSAYSADYGRAVIWHPESTACTRYPALDPAAPQPSENAYRADLSAGSYSLLNPAPPFGSGAYNQTAGQYAGGSDDFSHIVYESTGAQTAGAPTDGRNMVFDWDEGALSLVSRSPGTNVPLAGTSKVPYSGVSGISDGVHSVSADGSRIFFQNPAGSSTEELYMREGGAVTFDVSESECTSSCGAAAADRFEWATPSGDKAFFLSEAKLTDDDNSIGSSDLYMFTPGAEPAAEPHNLTLLSRDEEPSDGSKAEVVGMLGLADNGDTVYFAARSQIVAGAPLSAGTVKIYRWRWNGGTPTVDFLAAIEPSIGPEGIAFGGAVNWSGSDGVSTVQPANVHVTPDGRYLLLVTSKRLEPLADRDEASDVYRWSAAEGWICVSCQPPGQPSAGESTIKAFSAESDVATLRIDSRMRIDMSDDGSRIFFISRDPLAPTDVNGTKDIYEWENGTLLQISNDPTAPAGFIGASESGNDVFFETTRRLVGSDTDNAGDIYDARVEGGFPAPPAPPPSCEEGGCAGAGTTAPPPNPAGTAGFQGAGNVVPPACRKGFVRKGARCVKKPRHHRRKHHRRARAHKANFNRRASR